MTASSGLHAVLAVLAVAVPTSLQAQSGTIAGHALRVAGTDTVPLARATVVLHRLSAAAQGPIDSAAAGADGAFRFRVTPDSQALLLVSTSYSGIEYFSRPVRLVSGAPVAGLLILAADTSSTAPVALAARYLVLSRPGPGNVRGVLDLIVLQNRGGITRVAPDTSRPAWSMRLPAGLLAFEVGEGEVSAAAVSLKGDTLAVASPIPPGERQLVVTYTLPGSADRYAIPLDAGADSAVVLVEEASARVTSPGFRAADTTVIDGRTYRRWVATGLGPGEVMIRVPVTGPSGARTLQFLAAALALALFLAGAWVLRRSARRPERAAARPAPETPAMLIEQIARLDQQHAGREAELGAEAWARYQESRARLVAAWEEARRRQA